MEDEVWPLKYQHLRNERGSEDAKVSWSEVVGSGYSGF